MKGWDLQIDIPDQTRRAIAALKDKAGLGRVIARAMDRQNELTVGRIQQKLSGEVLHVRTGLLRKSIGRTQALVLDNEVRSTVGSGAEFGHASVIYAAIHEFGGVTKPHEIRAKNAKALAFQGRGGMVFRRAVHHPGSRIPARSYIGSTLTEREPDYRESIGGAVADFFGGN